MSRQTSLLVIRLISACHQLGCHSASGRGITATRLRRTLAIDAAPPPPQFLLLASLCKRRALPLFFEYTDLVHYFVHVFHMFTFFAMFYRIMVLNWTHLSFSSDSIFEINLKQIRSLLEGVRQFVTYYYVISLILKLSIWRDFSSSHFYTRWPNPLF